jgi:predicted MarR family transcription regulator
MNILSRNTVLNTMIKHETLIVDDIGKEQNMGFEPNKEQLQYSLDKLTEGGYLTMLSGVKPFTYTITDKGITEGKRLNGKD